MTTPNVALFYNRFLELEKPLNSKYLRISQESYLAKNGAFQHEITKVVRLQKKVLEESLEKYEQTKSTYVAFLSLPDESTDATDGPETEHVKRRLYLKTCQLRDDFHLLAQLSDILNHRLTQLTSQDLPTRLPSHWWNQFNTM